MPTSRTTAVVAAAALAAAACVDSLGPDDPTVPAAAGPGLDPTGAIDRPPYPDPDWATGDPRDHGLDPAGLDRAAAIAAGDGSRCLLVIRHGVLVYERYFDGAGPATTHPSWSLAKSYAATAVGIAVDRGDLDLDRPVADYLAAWRDPDHQTITVRDLVSMTSGLEWSAFEDYVAMAMLAPDHSQFALDLPGADPPGTTWVYHNGGVQVLEPLFRAATGTTIEAYTRAHLWDAIGMTATWAHDDAGHPTAYANVAATCRDHARLGYLYLHGGRWRDHAVVSRAWVDEALAPSQELNRAYGFLFWLNRETPALDAMMQPWPGRMVPFAPPDLFAARGFGNQFIDVVPSLDLIVVRFGADPLSNLDPVALARDARFELHDALLAPILDAVTPAD